MEAYIARQPVFDTQLEVYAQELLFHSEGEDDEALTDRDRECSSVIAESLMPGFERLTGGKLGLVSIPYGSLVREEVSLLPPESTLLAIHESVDADDLVVHTCHKLKDQGFRIALDNFHRNAQQYLLLDLADVVKVDVPATGLKECRRLVKLLRPRGTRPTPPWKPR
jgi:EAL and modified HD-GYP domain-containing signal transduction protein